MYAQMMIVGNLTKQPDLKYIPSGKAVAKCSIAYTDGFGDKKTSHFIDIELWGKTAEAFNQYCKKGSKIMVVGFPKFEQWTAQDGTNRNRHSLRVDTMKMLGSNDSGNSHQNSGVNPDITYEKPPGERPSSSPEHNTHQYKGNSEPSTIPEIDIDEDEIPF